MRLRFLPLLAAFACVGGCALVYRFGDYTDASAGGAGNCLLESGQFCGKDEDCLSGVCSMANSRCL